MRASETIARAVENEPGTATVVWRLLVTLAATLVMLVRADVVVAMPATLNVPGGLVAISLPTEGDIVPKAWFQGRRALVVRASDLWIVLIGLPLDIKPGEHVVRIDFGTTGTTRPFVVAPKAYAEQRLTIANPRKVDPNPEDLKRIRREQETLNKVRATWTEAEAIDLEFILPAEGPLTSRFGLRRVLNGQPRSPHNGLDVGVPRGTPIHSAAAGTIIATGDFFFAGKTVFVDHGQGLLSMYCHLDEISAQPGMRVARAEPLGRSGMTGRVTGPHLHWSIYLNGTSVDPELFLNGVRKDK